MLKCRKYLKRIVVIKVVMIVVMSGDQFLNLFLLFLMITKSTKHIICIPMIISMMEEEY